MKNGLKLVDTLSSFELFEGVDSRYLKEWVARAHLVEIAEGQKLFEQGEAADCLYIVVEGMLEVFVAQEQCDRMAVGVRGPGSLLGEIALLTGGKRGASVFARERSTLVMLGASELHWLLKTYPEMKQRFIKVARDRLRTNQWIKIMKQYFGEVDEATLKFIESHIEWLHVARGETVFTKGEAGDSLYFLVHGLLSVVDSEPPGREKVIGLVYRREFVGEMSLLTGEKRAASTYAMRESDLVRLTRTAFQAISAKYPSVTLAIARILVERLKLRNHQDKRSGVVSVALVCASAGTPLQGFAGRLQTALCKLQPTALINSRRIDEEFSGQTIADSVDDEPHALDLAAWLEEQESYASFILYEADAAFTPWTRRCIERADQVLLVAMADENPAPSDWQKECWKGPHGELEPKMDLVLIHGEGGAFPAHTLAWLNEMQPRSHQHVRWHNDADFSRLARVVGRRSVGLVLGGGGAKGFAHIGVLRAFAEAGIPIDMIGGSSMGSVIAGLHALGWDYTRMIEAGREIFLKQKPFKELALPIISLVRGRKIDKALRSLYGDGRIEDLWTSFFCTTSNLNSCELKVHRRGVLWRAIRASCSLPGVMAPIPFDGEVHLDGGVLNNLPCDVMRQDAGFVIAVDVDAYGTMTVDFPEFPSPWKVIRERIIRGRHSRTTPNIIDIIISTFRASNRVHVNEVKEQADVIIEPPVHARFGILDFDRLESIVQIGYDSARKMLYGLPEDSPLRRIQAQLK